MAPTIKEVAKRSGVGIGTVSRVLNNSPQISEETRRKVLKAMEELNYVPNVAGRRLSQKKSNVIAIIVPIISHPYFAKLIAEIEKEADLHGYSVLLVASQRRIEKEIEVLNRLRRHEADGAIFVTHNKIDESKFKGLSLVSIDRHLGKDIPLVTTNNYEATKEGVEYLISKGCKSIAYVGTKPNLESEVSYREQAYKDVMKAHHMKEIIINDTVNHGEEETLIDELFTKYKGKFDGVFVSGCTLADILYARLYYMKIDCPKDLQFVSYDGDFYVDQKVHITTLEQPLDLMAKRCIELLTQLIDQKENVELMNKFDCRLLKGETTK